MESSYLKESQKRDTSSPSLPSASYLKDSKQKIADDMPEETIKITLSGIEIKKSYWQEFIKRLGESGQTLEEYFTYAVNDEIENALFHDPRLLEPVSQE